MLDKKGKSDYEVSLITPQFEQHLLPNVDDSFATQEQERFKSQQNLPKLAKSTGGGNMINLSSYNSPVTSTQRTR